MKTNANIKCSYNNDLLTLITMFKSVIVIKEKLRGMDRYVLRTKRQNKSPYQYYHFNCKRRQT